MIPVEDRAGLPPAARAEIEALVQSHRGLDDLVRWGRAEEPPVRIAEVVVQDELSHDVLVPFRGALWLVYETT